MGRNTSIALTVFLVTIMFTGSAIGKVTNAQLWDRGNRTDDFMNIDKRVPQMIYIDGNHS
jgi:hypothetical protein